MASAAGSRCSVRPTSDATSTTRGGAAERRSCARSPTQDDAEHGQRAPAGQSARVVLGRLVVLLLELLARPWSDSRSPKTVPRVWSVSCCRQRASRPSPVNVTGSPSSPVPVTRARVRAGAAARTRPGRTGSPRRPRRAAGRGPRGARARGCTPRPTVRSPSASGQSKTKTARSTPIWQAARPTPSAAYIVATMSATRRAQLVVVGRDRACGRCITGVPQRVIGRTVPPSGSGPYGACSGGVEASGMARDPRAGARRGVTGDTGGAVAAGVTRSYIIRMSLTRNLRPGGKHGARPRRVPRPDRASPSPRSTGSRRATCSTGSGCASRPSRRSSRSPASGFRTATAAGRTFDPRRLEPTRRACGCPAATPAGRLRPDPDRGRADARRRRAASTPTRCCGRPPPRPTTTARRPPSVLEGRPGDRAADPRRARVARRHLRGALGDGRHAGGRGARPRRHGPGGRRPGARRGRHRARRSGAPSSSRRPTCPAFTGDDVPAAALALNEPTVLFDVLAPATTARPRRRRLRARRREVAGAARRRRRAVRRRRAARRAAGAVPRRVRHRRAHRRGRPGDGRAGGRR